MLNLLWPRERAHGSQPPLLLSQRAGPLTYSGQWAVSTNVFSSQIWQKDSVSSVHLGLRYGDPGQHGGSLDPRVTGWICRRQRMAPSSDWNLCEQGVILCL